MRWHKEIQHPRITRANLTPDCGSRLVPVLYQSWIFEPLPDPGGTLTAVPLTTGAASLGSPAITQSHNLTASALTTGASAVGSPAITQRHTLASGGLTTGAATVGSPVFSQRHSLTASALTAGSSTVGNPVLMLQYNVAASPLTTGAATVGNPVLQSGMIFVHLTADDVTTAPAYLESPWLLIATALTASGITLDHPDIGWPACHDYPPEEWAAEVFKAHSAAWQTCNSTSTINLTHGEASTLWPVINTMSDSHLTLKSISPLTEPS